MHSDIFFPPAFVPQVWALQYVAHISFSSLAVVQLHARLDCYYQLQASQLCSKRLVCAVLIFLSLHMPMTNVDEISRVSRQKKTESEEKN